MRYVRQTASAVVVFSFLFSSHLHGQGVQDFSVTNYQFVSEQRWSRTQSYVTYRADLVNTGTARDAVTASVTSLTANVQTVPGQTNLSFAPVPASGRVTSSNTFTILVDRSVLFDFASLQWSFLSPFASAGRNQTVAVGATVVVDGSASTNPSGAGALSYKWAFASLPPGTGAKLLNADSVLASFVVDVPGNYILALTVSNGFGSDTATVTVSTGNSSPVANAGPNQTVGLGVTVVLNGGGSSDVNGAPLTYSWILLSRPAGSAAALTGPNTISPTFVADMPGSYVAQLTVNDPNGNSNQSTVQITTGNTPPVANAGPNQLVNVGAVIQLDASGSTDVNGDPLTYHWIFNSRPGASAATLNNPTSVNPTFTVDAQGTYVVQLIVNDGLADSYPPSTVTVTTNVIQPPTASAGPDQAVQHGATVYLSGSATDPQGLPLTLVWSLMARPPGSASVLSGSTTARPMFVADLPGTYVAQLIASNGFKSSAPSTVTIATTNVAPVANAGSDVSVASGATATLDGSGSSDADHDPLTFSWSLLTRPNGSNAYLSAASSPSPTFVADVAGIYVAQLIVNDGFTKSNPSTVAISAGLTTITLTPNPLNLATNSSSTLTVTLGEPAGPGGLVVTLASSDTNIASVPPNITIPENATSAGVTLTSGAPGSAFILAAAPGFQPGSATVNASVAGITLALDSTVVGVGTTTKGTITLSNPASSGGVVVTLVATPNGIVTVPPSVTIASGSTGTFMVTGVGAGAAILTANASGYSNATANVFVSIGTQLAITTTSLPGGVLGAAYSATASAGGGTTPYSWSATGLPAGLSINASTGVISGTPTAAGTSTVAITVTDSSSPTHRTATANLSLAVVAQLAITTTSLPTGFVGTAYSATVSASGGTTPYSWSATGLPAGWSINTSTGVISGTLPVAGTSTVAITATDSSPTHQTATANLSLTIGTQLAITTTSLPGGVLGAAYSAPVSAGGGTTPYSWSATGLPAGLSINASTGVISGTPTTPGTGIVAITVTDSTNPAHLTATANLPLEVVAALSITTTTLPGGTAKVPYSTTVTATGGTTPYTWSATGLPPGLTMNASTGVIGGTATSAATNTITITVTDATSPTHLTATKNLSLTITGQLTITTASLPAGLVGTAYSTTVNVAGGMTPYTWSATNLPAGLTINASTGVISGTPTTAGAKTAAITVTDSTTPTHLTATANLSLTIAAQLTITTTSLAGGVVGTAYSATVNASGGTTPYTWSATGLPAGLSINASSGVISGTPTTAGSSTVAITVTDAITPTHLTATANLPLAVVAPLSITTASPLPGGFVNAPYSATVVATGGKTPYTWSATGLPAGLSISASTGVISGTPTAQGTATVVVTVADSTSPSHLTATKNLSLTIAAQLTITTTSLSAGVVGTPYSAIVNASGGTPPYTWSATGLPAGLSINASSGVISGTPTTAGSSTAAITVTDSTTPTHLTATVNLPLAVVAPLSITTASPLPGGFVDTPYSATVAATGGKTPYTWSATGLPAGLTIDTSTGAISGTPTAQATATVVVTVADSTSPSHLTATKNMSLSIGPPQPASIIATAGAGQSAQITTQFASQLQATVRDASSIPVGGVVVTFTAPSSGASVSFSTGGNTVNVTTNAAGIATAPQMIANAAVGSYTVTASIGTLSPAGFTLTNTAVGLPALSVNNISVGQNLQSAVTVGLPAPAGPNGVLVTLSSGDPNKVLLANGKSSVQTTIAAGQTQVSILAQGLVSTGSVQLTASAAGYQNATGTVTLTPSGFVLAGPNNIGASFQTYQLLTTVMTVYSARLDSLGKYVEQQTLRGGLGSSVTVNVTSTSAGTVTPASLTFNPTDSSATTTFQALNLGSATIRVQAPPNFSPPTDGSDTVVATILPSGCTTSSVTVGQNLQTNAAVALNGVVGSSGSVLTITSSDPTRLKFSTASNTAGSGSITINLPPNAHGSPDFYVQGFGNSGTVTYTAQPPGFGTCTGTATLAPSGILFTNSFGGVPNPLLAAVGGSPVTVTVYSAILDSAGAWAATQPVAGGLSASVNVTNAGSASVGTVSPTIVTIAGGNNSSTTQFQPGAAGSTNLSVTVPATPPGFSTPSTTYSRLPVSVTTSKIVLTADQIAIGKDLQVQGTIFLNQAAPPGGLSVTLTSNSSLLLLAAGPTDAGTNSVQINVQSGSNTAVYYVQATGDIGTATYKATATGYADGLGTITLTPSGVVLSDSNGVPFVSTTVGNTVVVNVTMAQLNPADNSYIQTQPLRGGLSLSVTVGTGNPGIATVVTSPVTIAGGADPSSITTTVLGVAKGQTPVTVTQPPGYVNATNNVTAFHPMPSINVTVI